MITTTLIITSHKAFASKSVALDCTTKTDNCVQGSCAPGDETRQILRVDGNSVENIDGDYGFLTFKNSCERTETHLECFDYSESYGYVTRSLTLNPMTGRGTIDIKVYESVQASVEKKIKRQLVGTFFCKKYEDDRLF